ncbi:hypothetical protein [Caballeronia ptereochthonis]|uniref:Uncharacterized protein n=1 Tax=Caballeronia ptereochthonis TaxID=1777144 RepID=A0A158ASK2_9BURK|nr:hypothetical protein [Caballeronia ptereochthonis]SAK60824.1 hypothetical protein AWB83_02290 [Caballeronia ptereochthonis]
MRHVVLARMRANGVLFAISVAVTEVLALLVLAASGRIDDFSDETTRVIVLVVSFALVIATKIQARSAFEAAASKGHVTQGLDEREGSRLVVADECPAAWLVQLHVESCADVGEAPAPRKEAALDSRANRKN